MGVKIIFDDTFNKLKDEQKTKPPRERLIVPTIQELADAVGISKTAYINFMKDRNESINKKAVETTVRLLNEYGHDIIWTDIVTWID